MANILDQTKATRTVDTLRAGILQNARALQDSGFLETPTLDAETQAAADRQPDIKRSLASTAKKLKTKRPKPGQRGRAKKRARHLGKRMSSIANQTGSEFSRKTTETVADQAETVLREYQAAVAEGVEWKIEQTRRQLSKWSLAANAFEPNLLLDWVIDREEPELEEGLGVRSLAHMEIALAEKYRDPENPAPCHHVHLGAGDYSIVDSLQNNADHYADATEVFAGTSNVIKRYKLWNEVGVSDKLYLSLEKILWKFVRPQMKRHPAVKEIVSKLTLGLQTCLVDEWYAEAGPKKQLQRKPDIACLDLNKIFELLATPEFLMQHAHFYDKGEKFLSSCTPASPEFANERLSTQRDNRPMSMDAHAWLIAYQEKFTRRTLDQYRQARHNAPPKSAEALEWLRNEARELFGTALNLPELKASTESPDAQTASQAQNRLWELCRMLENDLSIELDALPPSRLDVSFVMRLIHKRIQRMFTLFTGETYRASPREKELLSTIETISDAQWLEPRPANLQSSPDHAWAVLNSLYHEFRKRIDEHLHRPHVPNPPLPADPLHSTSHELLEQIFTPELLRGVKNAEQYTNPQYRKTADYKNNGFHHIEPTDDTQWPITINNVPDNAMVVLRSDRDLAGETEYLATNAETRFSGCRLERTANGIRINRDLFPAGFVVEVVSLPDLNEHAVFFDGHIPGKFEELGKIVPDQSCLLATASRSQSHESDRQFYTTVENTITKLEPGGCMLTDGCIQSYTRIMRFIESQDEHFHVDVLVDRETHTPKSMLIQRAHPGGYFTNDEKAKFLSPDIYVKSVGEVYKRRDLKMKDDVRRWLLGKYKNPQAFVDIHPKLDEVLREELAFAGYGAVIRRQTLHDTEDQRRAAVGKFRTGIDNIREPMRLYQKMDNFNFLETMRNTLTDQSLGSQVTPDIAAALQDIEANLAAQQRLQSRNAVLNLSAATSPSRLLRGAMDTVPVKKILRHMFPDDRISTPELPSGEVDINEEGIFERERDNDQLVRLTQYWTRNVDYKLPLSAPSIQDDCFNLTDSELTQASDALSERVQIELDKRASLRDAQHNRFLLFFGRMRRNNPGLSEEEISAAYLSRRAKILLQTAKRRLGGMNSTVASRIIKTLSNVLEPYFR